MRIIRTALAAAALMLAGAAQAASSFSSLYVFGDSLVDSGNAQIASAQAGLPDPAPSTSGYFAGRFSNGPTFADYVNQSIDETNTVASFAGGRNYGFGGALTAFSEAETRRSFLTQLNDFGSQTIASDALVLVTFGGNDIRATVDTAGDVAFPDAIEDLRTGLTTLIGAGARTIIVTGLPDIGLLPGVLFTQTAERQAELTERSESLNASFKAVTNALAASSGQQLRFFDLLDFQRDVYADPTSVGLPANLNTTIPCQFAGPLAVGAGCNGFLYFDPIHPTTQVHRAIADGILAVAAIPEPSSWALLIVGFGATGVVLRRRSTARGVQQAA